MTRIVTGIKPTGTPHLGNYLGMLEPALRLARDHEACLFVADYHALNTAPDPATLGRRSFETAATCLALGLDPARSALYLQSAVPATTELAQILAAVTPKGLLNRAHAYKAAVADNRDRGADEDVGVNMGLFTYPLLMAADILAPGGELVPVGADQQQHLDITRDIATAFNARYGPTLAVPEAAVDGRVAVVPGTDSRKMSKSHANTIPVLGVPDAVRSAVMGIVTDSRAIEEPKDPERDITFRLFELVAPRDAVADLRERYLAGGLRYVDAKRLLVDVVIERFAEARARFAELTADPATVDDVLERGAERVRTRVEETLGRVRQAVGVAA